MKTVFFLAGDYWHPAETIRPVADALFDPSQWQVTFTKQPEGFLALAAAPGHVTPNLICEPYLRVMRNAVRWCAG